MNTTIYSIELLDLFWGMIPVAIVIVIYMRWTQDRATLFYALFRMLIQLILIGYVLTYIFASDSPYLVILILFAVGLVSLPRMIKGQILSGVDPLIAVRYQMMVMLMILGSAGISVAIYLVLINRNRV